MNTKEILKALSKETDIDILDTIKEYCIQRIGDLTKNNATEYNNICELLLSLDINYVKGASYDSEYKFKILDTGILTYNSDDISGITNRYNERSCNVSIKDLKHGAYILANKERRFSTEREHGKLILEWLLSLSKKLDPLVLQYDEKNSSEDRIYVLGDLICVIHEYRKYKGENEYSYIISTRDSIRLDVDNSRVRISIIDTNVSISFNLQKDKNEFYILGDLQLVKEWIEESE